MNDSLERTDCREDRHLGSYERPGAADGGESPRPTGEDGTRLQITTLAAAVTTLNAERDALEDQIAKLEAQRRSLEATVETLETKLDAKDRQQQQIIDTYERLLSRHENRPAVSGGERPGSDDGQHGGRPAQSSEQSKGVGSSLLGALVSSNRRVR